MGCRAYLSSAENEDLICILLEQELYFSFAGFRELFSQSLLRQGTTFLLCLGWKAAGPVGPELRGEGQDRGKAGVLAGKDKINFRRIIKLFQTDKFSSRDKNTVSEIQT